VHALAETASRAAQKAAAAVAAVATGHAQLSRERDAVSRACMLRFLVFSTFFGVQGGHRAYDYFLLRRGPGVAPTRTASRRRSLAGCRAAVAPPSWPAARCSAGSGATPPWAAGTGSSAEATPECGAAEQRLGRAEAWRAAATWSCAEDSAPARTAVRKDCYFSNM
jgi:hypothetical protein